MKSNNKKLCVNKNVFIEIMLSQSHNRVQAIKSKFENLNSDNVPISKKSSIDVKCKIDRSNAYIAVAGKENTKINEYEPLSTYKDNADNESDTSDDCPKPNTSYLYKSDVKRSLSDTKKVLSRQISDPGKKLHRSHAFRCDRSQKITNSPKRHDSCNGRSETRDFSLKMGEQKLSKDRLKRLGNFLEDQMRKENFVLPKLECEIDKNDEEVSMINSIPDSEVPKYILDQYAKVIKPKRKEDKQDAMTDSGVSSETENLEDEKSGRIKRLMSQFENNDKSLNSEESPVNKPLETESNLETMDDMCASSETMKLERKNPHLTLTDTLKKALKQPLPPGPPPKKPPRSFVVSPIPENPVKQKKDPRQMLEKLEMILLKREARNQAKNEQNQSKNVYDIAETDLSSKKPKEIHYLCTEILDITQRTLLPNQSVKDPLSKCFNSLNCAIINNSMSSLPYTRLSTVSETNSNRNSLKMCCSCSNNSLDQNTHLSTFLAEKKCLKCQTNDEMHNRFKCHLNCDCKMVRSEFFVDNEHIYDEPCVSNDITIRSACNGDPKSRYGTLNLWKMSGSHSKSLEDLRMSKENQQIYEIPSIDNQRPLTPETTAIPKAEFKKLRESFENGFQKGTDQETKKPSIIKPKPLMMANIKVAKSTENLVDVKYAKRNVDKKFHTETKRYRNRCELLSSTGFYLPKRNSQLDVDRENLNRLMNEIYETVTAACDMENKPGSFPTDQSDGSTSEDSVKITRSLTEKRKNYVRRVSSRVAYLEPKNIKPARTRHQTSICSYKSEIIDNPYSTFRSWKSFRTSQNNLTKEKERRDSTDSKVNLTDSKGNILSMDCSNDSIDKMSIDEKAGCVDIELPFEPRERGLFNVCLLVGLNYMTGQAYVKSVFPNQVQVPPHIENLIFPETLCRPSKGEWSAEARGAQCYSLVLTDERGERSYGYCRRVLPEGATTCLPLCYCVIGRYRAPGFYYKVLQEIESHHGSSEIEINSILQQLFETDFPNPGEDITITYTNKKTDLIHNTIEQSIDKCATMPDMRRNEKNEGFLEKMVDVDEKGDSLPEFYDIESNNNGPKRVIVNFEGPRIRTIKRPLEPRIDEDNLSTLFDLFGAGLVIKVFGSLLLERKVVIIGDKLSSVSMCMEALQSALYPFVWQQPLISTIPAEIQRDVLEAPLPMLAGMLASDMDITGIMFEEGMIIDLTHPSKVLHYQGDESTILPTSSYKTLKTSLQMESIKNKDKSEDSKTRNVMISEAFMRFFVDILGDFWRYFNVGVMKDGDLGKGDVIFDKESFVKNAPSKQNQYFLEWFTETAMFNHFIQNMAACYHTRLPQSQNSPNIDCEMVDTPLPNFYQLFEERVQSRGKTNVSKNVEGKSNYKNAVNKRVKMLKTKLRELVT